MCALQVIQCHGRVLDVVPGPDAESLNGYTPAHGHAGPGEADTEGHHHDVLVLVDEPGIDGLYHGQRDGGAGGVAVAIDIDEDLVHRHLQPLLSGFDDAQIGLMRDEHVDLVQLPAGPGCHPRGTGSERQRGELEYLVAHHVYEMVAGAHRLFAGRFGAPTGGQDNELAPGAIVTQLEGLDTVGLRAGLQHHRPGAI